MKKQILIAFMLIGGFASAQQSVPNGNFELWNTMQFNNPRYFGRTSNAEVYGRGLPFNCEKTTDAYHGTYAVKITSVANATSSMFGYIVNGNPEEDPGLWHGGIPYSQMAQGMRGYYKSDVVAGDTAWVIVAFSKAGVNIGTYSYLITGQHTAYTLFNFTFSPALAQAPDSVMFAAVSSNVRTQTQMGVAGSMLQLDSISFTGVGSQPAQLNGDFEQWDAGVVEFPSGWNNQDNRSLVSIRSTDAYKGNNAVKLESRVEDGEHGPRVRSDNVSTGYYPIECNQCEQLGGYPFTRQADTLVFWYKYAPAAGSKAWAIVKVKKNGVTVGGHNIDLNAAATYQYMEIPFSAGLTPDTLIVQFQASRWEDSLMSHAGAVLYIDEVQLKSAPLNTGVGSTLQDEAVMVYPNPANTSLHVSLPASVQGGRLTLLNMMGQTVYTSALANQHNQVDINFVTEGFYLYHVSTDNCILQSGKLQIR